MHYQSLPILRLTRTGLAILFTSVLLVLTSCGTSRRASDSGHKHTSEVGKTGVKQSVINLSDYDDEATIKLLTEANSWIGTPYLYGGNTREGVDCSGFVLQVFLNAVDIPLPRTSASQREYCKSVDRSSLLPGDLVFFATSKKHDGVSHVGIYIGHDKMVHASSSKGVIISDLNSNYYLSHYHSAGRVERFSLMGKKKEDVEAPTQSVVSESNKPKKAEKKKEEKAIVSHQGVHPSPTEHSESTHQGVRHSPTDPSASTDTQSIRAKVLSGLPD